MSNWERVVIPDKGHFAGRPWIYGDLTGILEFSNYTSPYNDIPITGDEQHVSADNFVGYRIDNFNYFIQEVGMVTDYLVAAWNLSPQGGESGAYLCMLMSLSNYVVTENATTIRIKISIVKRLYDYAGTHYTQSYPIGTYFQEADYTLRSTTAPDNRQGLGIALFFKEATYNSELNYVIGIAHILKSGDTTCYGSSRGFRMKSSFVKSSDGWGANAEIPETDGGDSPEFGPAAAPGGYIGSQQGTHDKSTEHSGIPSKPQYGFTSAGFLNHYLITSQGLEQLGEAVFPEPAGLSTSVEQAIDRLVTNQWNSKLVDYIIDCRIIPVMPHDSGYHDLSVGGKVLIHPDTQAIYRAALIDEDFVDVNCGTITTDLVEGNFLDFYNMSAKLFLPFYGFVDIAPEYWMGATLGVQYRFNMMDGSFMVWITSKAFGTNMNTDDVIAQYAGNACIHLPINTQAYGNIISGMITTGAAIVGAAATGGPLGVAGAMASGAANIINSRPQLNANNSYNGSAALMSKRTPYLLIEFNNAQFSTKYTEEQGLPLVVTRTLGTLRGMTVCMDPIINFACADDEAAEIQGLLKSGVIL